MELTPGVQFGPYQLVSPIGEGGMGEVWKARDTRLERDVALKVSKADFTDRFEREARAIAAFNHPNICTLHDIGPNFLVMELIDGVSPKGPMPAGKAVAYAGQILEALDAAHRRGFTHRDLKPANILVTKQGIKLLDFGLAKRRPVDAGPDDMTAITATGQISGTLQYMSPEQLEGKEADARSDIFAFGCVLYEMLSGAKAFPGSTAASVIAAILEREPQPLQMSPPLDRVIRKCLMKDPDQRFQNALDLKTALFWALESGSVQQARAKGLPFKGWMAAAALAGIAAVAFLAPWRSEKPQDRSLVRLDVDLGPDVSLPAASFGGSAVSLSPGGTRLAFVSGTPTRLFIRQLDQPKATELPGTQGASGPFFSADGQWLGFVAANKLNKISVNGGPVVFVSDIQGVFAGAAWSEDGSLLGTFGSRGLMRIPAAGPASTITDFGGKEHNFVAPQILPGGKALLFMVFTSMNVDENTIEVLTLADGRRKVVVHGGQSPVYVPTWGKTGHVIYTNKSNLFAVPFDPEKLETKGTAVPVLDDVGYESMTKEGQFRISPAPAGHGTLVYRRSGAETSGLRILEWAGPTGSAGRGQDVQREALRMKPAVYGFPSISPDGTRVAMSLAGDIWVYDLHREALTRLTFGKGFYTSPLWSPDGKYLVFSALSGIFQVRADGSGQPQILVAMKGTRFPASFTPDGKRLAYYDVTVTRQIGSVPLEEEGGHLKAGAPEAFIENSFAHSAPAFSPDGQWLAYQSNESGRNEIYVRSFPLTQEGKGGKWQVSNDGGMWPQWSQAGHELMYQSGSQILVASYTVKGSAFVADTPRVWMARLRTFFDGGLMPMWKLASDGKRVLEVAPVEDTGTPKGEHEVTFLENFFDELRRKAPAGK